MGEISGFPAFCGVHKQMSVLALCVLTDGHLWRTSKQAVRFMCC
jgi:hypothetical protein